MGISRDRSGPRPHGQSRRPGVSETMATGTDIAIAGGGLNGATLALALARAGFSVTLIDAADPESQTSDAFDGRSYALALSSQRLFAALGLWPGLADHAQPMLEIKVSDGRAGEGPSPFFMHFDHGEIEEGPMGYMVEDRHLRRALITAVQSDDRVTYLTGVRVTTQKPGESDIALTLSDGCEVSAGLLAGCDGRGSDTARRAGIKRLDLDYGQTALVCAVDHQRPHQGTAQQFFMPPGPLAILPLKGNRSSIVWTETTARASEIQALDSAGYLEALRPRFGDFLGDIGLSGTRFAYPLSLSLAHSFVGTRLVLAGDAAHGIHPIAGQGLNAGLRDVAALAEVLSTARRRGEDFSRADVLARYAQWRRFDTAALAMATDAVNRIFSNDNSLLRLGRDITMGVIGAVPGLRRGLIRLAAGLTGDVPRLMRGLPL